MQLRHATFTAVSVAPHLTLMPLDCFLTESPPLATSSGTQLAILISRLLYVNNTYSAFALLLDHLKAIPRLHIASDRDQDDLI